MMMMRCQCSEYTNQYALNVETAGSFKMSPCILNQVMVHHIAEQSNLYCDNLSSHTILLVIVFGCKI